MKPLPPSITRWLHVLTKAEKRVLSLLARGLTTQDIGEALAISPRTAAIHVQRIVLKLKAKDADQAVAIAVREGIVTS